jgi:site-specific recombinase XerD
MKEDLQLAGFAERTQKSYLEAVRGLAKYYMRSPDLLTEEEVRDFFLHLINERKSAKSTVTIYLSGIKFFFETTLKREMGVFNLVRPAPTKRLPVVLSREEVRTLLKRIKNPIARMALTIIYACGLRLSEGACLRVKDIDSDRMLLWVRDGKGRKDRCVPLPECPLELLRAHYRIYGHGSEFLFPYKDGHINICTLQTAFRKVVRESGIKKQASVHSLRHSFATHLLESGEDISTLKEILGHTSIVTTNIYTHMTEKITDRLHVNLNGMMSDLQP